MHRSSSSLGRPARIAAIVAATGLAMLVPAVLAQDEPASAHPAHIHAGSCESLGDVVAPLTDVAPVAADSEQSGADSAIPVKSSETRVDMPLQEILATGHAVNVHLSADEIDTYIACGDIGGAVTTDEGGRTELIIALGELDDSGHRGIVWFGDDGDGTLVAIHLLEPEITMPTASDATPAAAEAAAATTVEIKGFKYLPESIAVPVGGSVSWTNLDNSPHTATGLDRDILQSGTLAFDESFTQTFDTAGSYEYFCEFHPNMKGTIVVE